MLLSLQCTLNQICHRQLNMGRLESKCDLTYNKCSFLEIPSEDCSLWRMVCKMSINKGHGWDGNDTKKGKAWDWHKHMKSRQGEQSFRLYIGCTNSGSKSLACFVCQLLKHKLWSLLGILGFQGSSHSPSHLCGPGFFLLSWPNWLGRTQHEFPSNCILWTEWCNYQVHTQP